MKNFVRMVMLSAVVLAVGLTGCGGDDNSNNGGGGGGDANHDIRLVCDVGEAWFFWSTNSSCESVRTGGAFKSNGDKTIVRLEDDVWTETFDGKWQTNGNKLIQTQLSSREEISTYEISEGTMTLTFDSGERRAFKKCNGVTIVG